MFDAEELQSQPVITHFLRQVSEGVTEGLAEYNVSLSPHETLWATMSWLVQEAEAQSTSPEVIAADAAVDDASLSIVALLLSSIAEERPGTYPFEHEATIPVPMPVAMRTIHALAIMINLAIQNGRAGQIGYLTGAIGALARIAAQQKFGEQETATPTNFADPDLSIEPPFCLVPQPGLAFCARIIEGAARDLANGDMLPSIDGQVVDVVQLVQSLESDALALRLLNRAFGINPNAPE